MALIGLPPTADDITEEVMTSAELRRGIPGDVFRWIMSQPGPCEAQARLEAAAVELWKSTCCDAVTMAHARYGDPYNMMVMHVKRKASKLGGWIGGVSTGTQTRCDCWRRRGGVEARYINP